MKKSREGLSVGGLPITERCRLQTPADEEVSRWIGKSVSMERVDGKLTRDLPSNIKRIEAEAEFEANSTSLLITLPIEVWTCLSHILAVNFVERVSSNNVLLS